MPFSIDSITFADEFNTGTTTNFTNGCLSDEWTATIGIEYKNILDANESASASFEATGTVAEGVVGYDTVDLQCFVLNVGMTQGLNFSSWQEYQSNAGGGFSGVEITVRNLAGTSLGVFTVKALSYSFGNTLIIVCDEPTSLTGYFNDARIVVTEVLTTANLDYKMNGAGNNGNYTPTIEFNGSLPANFSSNAATTALDATDPTAIPLPFKYDGAYQTGGLTIAGVSFTNDVQKFSMVHTFRCVPISVYSDGAKRQPSSFSGINSSLYTNTFGVRSSDRYGFEGNFSNQVSGGALFPFKYELTPEIAVFSESYSGGTSRYSISNVVMVRTSDSEVTTKPLISEKFTVTFNINNTAYSPFSPANTKVKVGVENIPVNIPNTEDYIQTYLSDYVVATEGAGAATGVATGDAASITNYTCTRTSNSVMAVSFDVEFSANAQTQINASGQKWFSIYCQTQDHTLDYTNSDRVVLSVFSGEGQDRILLDPITVNGTQFITSPYSDFSTGIDASEIDGFPVQLLVGSTQFQADWTNRTNLRIDKVSQLLVLKNSSTLEEISLDSADIPVNTFTLIDGEYPNSNYSVQKGFKIPSTEVRNLVEMSNVSDVSSVRTFEVRFPFFIRWEDYTELLMSEIPSSILDSNEPFDGRNYNVNRIDDLANWSLNYRITVASSEDGTTFSQDFDYTIPTTGYNAHPDVTARSITSYKPDGVTLQPTLSSGKQAINSVENTWIKYEATFSTPPSAISDFEIEIWAEAFENGGPVRIERISSINNLLSSSWFTDTGAGDGLIVKSIDGSKAVGDCLVNFQKLSKFDNFRLYGKIFDPKRPTEYLLAENGDNLVTEAGDKIIRDF